MIAADRHGRPSLLRKLGLGFLVLLVLLATLLAYAQTRHAFRHLLIPLAAQVTGAKVDVRDGQLSLRGALEVDGLVYEDQAAGVAFDAERLALTMTPWSFVERGVHRIDDLELKQANLRVTLRPEPAGVSIHKPEPKPASRLPQLPVAVMRARFEDVAFIIEGDDRRITGRTAAEIDQLGPGLTGAVTLRTDFVLSRAGETEDLSGALDLALSVTADPLGMPITWKGTNHVLVRRGGDGPLSDADSSVMRFDQTLEGELAQARQHLRLSSTVAIHRQGTQLGSADVMAAMDGEAQPAVTDVALTVKKMTADTVNLVLGKAAARVQGGRFDAGVQARIEGTRAAISATVTGSRVQLRVGDREVSPAMDVSLQHEGSFDSATRDLSIDTLTITVGDHDKPMLSGALDRPVSLRLHPSEGGTPPSGSAGIPAVWSLRLSPTGFQTLRPWLALLGPDALNGIAGGRVGGALAVTVHEQGTLVEIAGRIEAVDVMLRSERQDRTTSIGPLGIITEWKARLTGLRTLRLDPMTTTVSLKGGQVAALRVTGTGLVAGERALTGLDGTVTLEGLPGEALNPMLALWSPGKIGRARIDGRAEFAMDERMARWTVDLHGQDVQLRLPDAADDAPPLDWLSQLDGDFDRTSRQLRVGRLNVQVADRRHSLVTLALDQPLAMTLAREGGAQDAPAGGSREQPITLGLRVNRLAVDQLRPLLALAGSQTPAPVRGGALDADLTVTLSVADHIVVAGRLDLEQVAFAGSSAPITLGTNVTASVIGRSRIIVEVWEARALDGTRLLAQARLAGSAGATGETDLRLDLTADDPTELLARLGLLTNRQRAVLSGGRLTGEVRLAAAGSSAPLAVKADLRSTNLTLRLDKARPLTHTVSLQADVEVDAARTVADVRRIELAGESGGAQTGTLTASGRWPMAAGQAGAITLTIKEWDSGPSMEFFGFLPGRVPGPLPVTAEMTVTREADDQTLAVRGKESIGPMHAAVNGRPLEPATLHLQHDVVRSGEEIRVVALTLAADRIARQSDHLSLSGGLRTGSQPRLQLHGAVDALDADWYAALAAPASSHSSPGHKQTAQAAGPPVPLDLDVDVAIGTVTYRTLEIGAGRLVAKGDGHRMRATLEPTGLANGTVQGTVTVAMRNEQPEFAWDLKGIALDLGTLTKAWFGEPEPQVTGRGTFTAAGTGRGRDETLRQSLNAMVFFDVADGQFIKVPALEFLADQTRIDQFRGLGFRTLHGALDVKDGWVTLQQFRADGPVAGIEAGGKLALDGRLDVRVEPKIGPTLSPHVMIPCLDQLARTAEGFTVLPLAVTVTGTAAAPSYGIAVTPGNMVERQAGALVGTIADLLTGCRGGDAAKRFTEDALAAVKDTASDLIEDLFGGKHER